MSGGVYSDDECDDAAGSSIAYSSVVLWQRGRNTVLGLKYLIQIQIKQKKATSQTHKQSIHQVSLSTDLVICKCHLANTLN